MLGRGAIDRQGLDGGQDCCATCLRVYLSCTTTNHELLITNLGNYQLIMILWRLLLLSHPACSILQVYGYTENIKFRPFTIHHPPSFSTKAQLQIAGLRLQLPHGPLRIETCCRAITTLKLCWVWLWWSPRYDRAAHPPWFLKVGIT